MNSGLWGKRVLILRPEHQAGDLAERLAARGANPVAIPAIQISPPSDWTAIDLAIQNLNDFDWVAFTSANGVDSFVGRMRATQNQEASLPAGIAAIGPATEEALAARGIRATWLPPRFTTESMAEALPMTGSVLLVRAAGADTQLETRLKERGFSVSRVDAYGSASTNPDEIREAVRGGIDAVALTSASIAKSLAEAIGDVSLLSTVAVASIGPAASKAALEASIRIDVEADVHTVGGLIDALESHFSKTQ
ncbi:MAG: uroporphyrinogen-III synthase [Actinobacteria bacterium]|nr:uroporphyrinogen-III synthase [Actinomycetota bacterium]